MSGLTEPHAILARIHDYAASQPGDTVIRGFGWTNTSFENESLAHFLDELAVAELPAVKATARRG